MVPTSRVSLTESFMAQYQLWHTCSASIATTFGIMNTTKNREGTLGIRSRIKIKRCIVLFATLICVLIA
jgi:hypothetical protein